MRKLLTIAIGLFLYAAPVVVGQKISLFNNDRGWQYGAAVKASLEFAEKTKPVLRLGLSAGIGGFIIGQAVYPSLHGDLMFYTNGFGSPKNRSTNRAPGIDLLICGTITAGWDNRLKNSSNRKPGVRNYPLYYFSNFSRPPLQNPFSHSLSLGSNLIISRGHKEPIQQVGFGNIHIGQLQFSYANDGTPFQYMLLGDGKDRYYTGSGVVTFTFPASCIVDNWELSYHKFSGYEKDAFEIGNLLDFSFVNYGDDSQNNFNKSMISLTASSSTHHFNVGVSAFNQTEWDIQHIIHRYIFNAYHRVPHKAYITPRLGLYTSQTKIGMR